jgi:hypothetical protein
MGVHSDQSLSSQRLLPHELLLQGLLEAVLVSSTDKKLMALIFLSIVILSPPEFVVVSLCFVDVWVADKAFFRAIHSSVGKMLEGARIVKKSEATLEHH